MPVVQSRRRFLINVAWAGAAGLGGIGAASFGGRGKSLAAEPPPEVSTIRIESDPAICIAPQFVAEALLHTEGFTDIRYEYAGTGSPTEQVTHDEVDWTLEFAPAAITDSDSARR